MASATHQLQGSYATFPWRPVSCNKGIELNRLQGSYATFSLRPVSWNKGVELKQLQMVAKTDSLFFLRCKPCLSVGAPLVRGPKANSLRILAFQSNDQNDESGGSTSGSKSARKSVKHPYVHQGSEETLIECQQVIEETVTESPKMHEVQLSYTSEADETVTGSVAVQKLFMNWLTLLRTRPPNQVVKESLEGRGSGEILVTHNGMQKKERGELLKAGWCYFWNLDAKIKVPVLTLISSFLAVTIVYGAETSMDLIPVWVVGPFIVSFYVRMLQLICGLYVSCFMQTVKVLVGIPMSCIGTLRYIVSGKIKEDVHARLWQPVSEKLNVLVLRKRFQVWKEEKYMEFLESVWPRYFRTIKFLKATKLI